MHIKLSVILVLITICGGLLCLIKWSDGISRETSEAKPINVPGIPAGFSIVELSAHGFFVRLASPERATASTIHTIAETLYGQFDRIDLCIDGVHERGDEYITIIGNVVYDHDNNNIYSLNFTSK